jgi:hypothetical protein
MNPPPKTVPSKIDVKKDKTDTQDTDVTAEILQDGTTNDDSIQGLTSFESVGALADANGNSMFSQTPTYSWESKGGRDVVTQVNGLAEIKGNITIQTVYGSGANASQTSAYGRGTTPDDEAAGDTSLGFHESCHRNDYLNFLRTNLLPVFGGKVGQTRAQFDAATTAFTAAVSKYFVDMKKDSVQRTDEVGYKLSTFKAKGPRPAQPPPPQPTPGKKSASLWLNQDGDLIHPNAPDGGGGPGFFRGAVALNTDPFSDDLPHPSSPAGRNLDPLALTDSA